MQQWTLSFTPTFLNELLGLPQKVSKQISQKVKVLAQDPISARGDAKKLGGATNNVYRVRVGNYRLFYSFGQGWVKLLSVRKRDERTYADSIPGFTTPDTPPPDAALLDPQMQAGPDTGYQVPTEQDHDGDILPPAPTDRPSAPGIPLPVTLTEDRLRQWQIPPDYWPDLVVVQDEDALLNVVLPDKLLARILDNLFPRSIAEIDRQTEYILKTPEDLDRAVTGDLTSFLLKLDADQQRLLDVGGNGPTLVKGGPGTGKSVLALYRVQRLLDAGQAPVLFTTYTNALVGYSEQLLEHLLGQPPRERGVTVTTVDALVFKYVVGTHGRPSFATEGQMRACLETALQTADIPAANAFDRNVRRETLVRLGYDYLLEEFLSVIEARGLVSQEEYLSIERRGRMLPLRAPVRAALWAVYQAWGHAMDQQGVTTWERLRRAALAIVTGLPEKPYQALVIDEAQDLAPVALRFLLELVATPQHVYLTADASQSLYQRGFAWKQIHADLNVRGRTLLLRRNYRNTAEISAACATIMQETSAGDAECLTQEPSPYTGTPPTIALSPSADADGAIIQAFFTSAARRLRLPLHSGAVLCHSQYAAQRIAAQLTRLGMPAAFMRGKDIDITRPCIKVLTLHAAKGLEFPFVAVVRLEAGMLPHDTAHLPPEEVPAALDQQRRLLYVGCSRAMRALLVCGSHAAPSPLLAPLGAPHWKVIEG
jgi:superfamily I DNA/RNA helicase/mRNA-degrading endonuclease RelE of RelBE toxin-antitoxin system